MCVVVEVAIHILHETSAAQCRTRTPDGACPVFSQLSSMQPEFCEDSSHSAPDWVSLVRLAVNLKQTNPLDYITKIPPWCFYHSPYCVSTRSHVRYELPALLITKLSIYVKGHSYTHSASAKLCFAATCYHTVTLKIYCEEFHSRESPPGSGYTIRPHQSVMVGASHDLLCDEGSSLPLRGTQIPFNSFCPPAVYESHHE